MGSKRPVELNVEENGPATATEESAKKKQKIPDSEDQPNPPATNDQKPQLPRSIGIRVEITSQPKPSSAERKLGESPPLLKSTCQHDVSLPASFTGDYDFSAPAKSAGSKPAKEYPFTLDAFQRESIKCLERNESVLVAAHTSAGKTVVAEYAIALALREKQRVIYTSPIKALSNQKYRELESEFSDVGLMTGDTTINKNASCLVMTTEILRSMLYKGSEVVREVSWVIFDEVHYMRDKGRGVVWEETIILVPENVRFVFLSATIPNAQEFSEWIAHLKNQPCHTIYTNTRPVPLNHFIHSGGGEGGLRRVVDENGLFCMKNFETAMADIGAAKLDKLGPGGGGFGRRNRRQSSSTPGKSEVYRVVQTIKEKNWHPIIVFSFSRRDCESLAMQMTNLGFNSKDEEDTVAQVYKNAIDSLNEEDQNLPQVTAILPLLKRGIGIHHSGLLPIVKEVVEILFQEGLLKCLLATETFAMGVNMPAKTVVFTALRKYDGETFRLVSGGEYIQMSGRAGRRGIDEQGIAIMMCEEKLDPSAAKGIMSGSAEPLKSTFKLGYNMLLNLLRAEEADPEYVIARSLAQFQADKSLPATEEQLNKLERTRDELIVGGPEVGVEEHEARSYFKLRDVSEKLRKEIRELVHKPSHIIPFLQQGRLARVRNEEEGLDYGWGPIVRFLRRATGNGKKPEDERFSVDVLLRCVAGSDKGKRPRPYKQPLKKTLDAPNGPERRDSKPDPKPEWIVVKCSFKDLDGLSAIRVQKFPDLRPLESRETTGRAVIEIVKRFPDGVPMLDPFTDLGISDESLSVLMRKAEAVDEAMLGSPVSKCAKLDVLMMQWRKKQAVINKVKDVKKDLKRKRGIILKEELKRMKRVLRRLEFTDAEGIVQTKGRVACEVNTADELVITELLVNGNLNNMSPDVLVSLCSCFVVDESKKDENLRLDKSLQIAYDTLKTVCRRVATVTKESNIPIDVEQYIDSFNPTAMPVVYAWCQGKSFAECCEGSDLYEGSVIRCLRRLEELLRQLIAAVKGLQNPELEAKFEAGSSSLRRGIAFQASLYT